MNEEKLKKYVLEQVKKLASTKPTKKTADFLEESITSDMVKKLAQEVKAATKSVDLLNPLIAEGNSIVDKVMDEEKRVLRTPMGKEYAGIEMKEDLNETMSNYNKQKNMLHQQESSRDAWKRLMGYSPFREEE